MNIETLFDTMMYARDRSKENDALREQNKALAEQLEIARREFRHIYDQVDCEACEEDERVVQKIILDALAAMDAITNDVGGIIKKDGE